MQHWSEMAPLTCLMSVDATPLVLPRRSGVLPLLNLVEVGERLHIYSVSCLRICVLQSKTLNDCIAISQLHRKFAIFQKLQRNFRILHVKLHFFVSPFVPSPFGPPPIRGQRICVQLESLTQDTAKRGVGGDIHSIANQITKHRTHKKSDVLLSKASS